MNKETGNKGRNAGDDAGLIKAFQTGDRAAFDKLVLLHKDRVFSLCYRFLGDYQEAEDSAQDVFVKVFRSLGRFRFESSFSTWLYRVAVNTCKNRVKSLEYRYLKKSIRLDNSEIPGKSGQSMEGEGGITPMAELEKKERMVLIRKAIDSLPPEQKAVVILRDVEGLSYGEIADITGHKLGTVKSRLARARFGLKKILESII